MSEPSSKRRNPVPTDCPLRHLAHEGHEFQGGDGKVVCPGQGMRPVHEDALSEPFPTYKGD